MAIANQLQLADSCRQKQEFGKALRIIDNYMRLCSNDPDAFNMLGLVHRDRGDLARSEEELRKAVWENPSPQHQVNLAMTLLQQRKWGQGWARFAHRRDVFKWGRARPMVPFWEGQPLHGRRLLVFQEQGLGDVIQFARFIPHLKERGAASVSVHCHPQLQALLQGNAERLRIDKVITDREAEEAYDFQVPQMSLPGLLGIKGTSIEAVPYLDVPAGTPQIIHLAAEGAARRVAIAWACNPDSPNHAIRSCPLDQFGPVAEAGFELYSVQKEVSGPEAAQLDKLHARNLSPELTDMARTASAIRSVRALLTVDTSVAHLAGAMNVDTVLMLHAAADWRWHDDNVTSSWYPRVHIVRQTDPGRWSDIIIHAVAILRGLP